MITRSPSRTERRMPEKRISDMSFREAVTWACVSNIGFGLMSYLIKVSGQFSSDHRLSMGLMWFSCGYVSLFVLLAHRDVSMFEQPLVDNGPVKDSRGMLITNLLDTAPAENGSGGQMYSKIKNFSKDWWVGVLICMAGGVSSGLGQLFSMMSFYEDRVDAGPLASMITGDVILFALFARIVYKEFLNYAQWLSFVLYTLGLALMAHVSDARATKQGNVELGERISAMFFGFFATVAFFGINASIRVGVDYNTCETGGFILRGLVLGVASIGVLLSILFDGTLKSVFHEMGKDSWAVLILPQAAGLSQALGIYALGRALAHSERSILVAIVGCNPIVVLVLGALIDRDFPEEWQNCGMALALASVALISALADSK